MAHTVVSMSRGGNPIFFFDSRKDTGAMTSPILLDTGSIWIPSQQFVPTSPAGQYLALKIKSGELSFSNIVDSSTSPIIIGPSVVMRVDLQFDTTVTTINNASIQPSGSATFIFDTTNTTLLTAGNATISIFGASLDIAFNQPVATYDTDLEKITFAGHPDSSTLTISNGHTSLVDFTGSSVAIDHPAWVPDVQSQAPSTLSEALGTGSLALHLNSGTQVALAGSLLSTGAMDCGACVVLVGANEVSVSGSLVASFARKTTISLGKKSSIQMRSWSKEDISFFRYSNRSDGNQTWIQYSHMTAVLDQPRNVRNERASLEGIGAIILSKSGGVSSPVTAEIDISISPDGNQIYQFQSYALKNLFLKAELPKQLAVQGTLNGGRIDSGGFRMISNLRFVMPFLPDPYVTNLNVAWLPSTDTGVIGDFETKVSWDMSLNDASTVDVVLPAGTLSDVNYWQPKDPDPTSPNTARLQNLQDRLTFQQDQKQSYGPTLLDVSGNSSQFGVQIQTRDQPAPPVSSLYMQAPANRLRAVALPQVEWEPVLTPDPELNFPGEYDFNDSGPASEFVTNSVALIPVSPHEVVGGFVDCYEKESNSTIGALFTMPFGIVSYAHLTKIKSPKFISSSIQQAQPMFKSINYGGADQLSLRADGPIWGLGAQSHGATPSLPGTSMIMELYPRDPTDPNGLQMSVLGAPSSYTQDFMETPPPPPPGQPPPHGPLVPARRVDISGYGGSMFTEWSDDTVQTGVSQVDLEVIAGRAEREVVVQSMEFLYHNAKATRTVVIQRLNSGEMRRQVFLKATGDGTFNFADPAIITHSGLVQRVTNIRNMREVNDASYTSQDKGIEFWPVQYDCDVVIETTSSPSPILVPAINHRGYLTSRPTGSSRTNMMLQDYDYLLGQLPNKTLTLGGPIDCTVKISNLTLKLTGIGVDMTTNPATNGQEVAIAAYSIPEFAGNGEWSVLQKPAIDNSVAPTHLSNLGMPVIRQNQSSPASVVNALRFADPRDLLPTVPLIDYCILHTADTVRTLFPRPKLEDGLDEISSTLSPLIADSYAMANCAGVFPSLESCIRLQVLDPSEIANFKLPVDPEGFLKLQIPNLNPDGSFDSPIPNLPRILRGGDMPTLAAINEGAITLLIDSSPQAKQAFNFASQTVRLLSFDGKNPVDNALGDAKDFGMNKLVEVEGSLLNAVDLKPLLQETKMVLGKFMDPIKDVLAFLSKLGPLPALDVHMDADFTIHVSLAFNLEAYLNNLESLSGPAVLPVIEFINMFVEQFDFVVDHTQQLLTHSTKFGIKPVFKIPTPFTPVIALASATFDAAFANGDPLLSFGLGAGIGVAFGIGPFSAKGYVLVTQTISEAGGSFGIGTDILVKASVDLFDLIKADVVVETKVQLLAVRCKDLLTNSDKLPVIWGIAQFTLGIDVSVFLVLDVSFHTSGEWRNKFTEGDCQPEDFKPPP